MKLHHIIDGVVQQTENIRTDVDSAVFGALDAKTYERANDVLFDGGAGLFEDALVRPIYNAITDLYQ